MDPDVRRAIELLDAIAAEPLETGPVELSAEYRRAVEAVENLPLNRDGADKSWVWRALERDRLAFLRAVRTS
jgi:hypothetical protein